MKFSSIMGNSLRLDGGAMFGNAPKVLWSRWVDVDDLNRIHIASRCLLVETDRRKVLFETGAGAYMEPSLAERFGVCEPEHVLLSSLGEIGLTHEDITDIILSHLHFDHAGGLLSPHEAGRAPELLFPNARIHVGEGAWERARNPGFRDRASFIPGLAEKLSASDRLVLVSGDQMLDLDGLHVSFLESSGHTPGMIYSDLRWDRGRMVFMGDLIPGRFWVHLPITMGYDRFPEKLMEEKEAILSSMTEDNGWIFYTHDSGIAASRVCWDGDKKKYRVKEALASFDRLEGSRLSLNQTTRLERLVEYEQ